MSTCDGEMISLNKFLFSYYLKASTHYGYFELLPRDRKSRIVRGFPLSFCDSKSRYFFISGTGWETLSDDFYENGKSQYLVRISIVFFCFSFIS